MKGLDSVKGGRMKDSTRPTPSKSITNSSMQCSVQKTNKKKRVVAYECDPNPFQTNNKPTSVKVEQ